MNESANNTNPVILIGMPRSGSTLLTRVLNESSETLFLVNDFYYLQHVDSVNGFNTTNQELTKDFAESILTRIKARIERDNSPELECGLYFSAEAEEKLEKFVQKVSQKKNSYLG
ncbi:MAG: sulfotransferase [Oscillatoria sp. PMC 1068.18]|nr:sulfotransferase [Oscillatoria sp. PMC 1076.18]MEC4990954.1 sulfotransferase [Oscillatoria sp. PMC 1068.18]